MISVAKRVVLCADEESLRNPQLLGLEESNLQAVSWIECCATAEECRRAARRDGIEEAWVVSCDDMEPLNVAAALKYDDPCKKVYLACAVNNGSLASRASLAKVDGVLSQACFADRFVFAKSLWASEARRSIARKGAHRSIAAKGAEKSQVRKPPTAQRLASKRMNANRRHS